MRDALSFYFQLAAAKKSTFRFYPSQNNHKLYSLLEYNINWDCMEGDQEKVCICVYVYVCLSFQAVIPVN